MHTYEMNEGTIFNGNSDMSGDLFIRSPSGAEITVPAKDVIQFVFQRIADALILKIEGIEVLSLWGWLNRCK